jgi:cytochrome c oxidase cbb3-type subunit 3
VGPNLTDSYWIHGSTPLDIHTTVTDGVPEKGMVAWGNQLGPSRVQAVVAYVLTLKNTEVPGKAPEGDAVTPEQEAEAVAAQDAERGGGAEDESEETATEK